MEKVTRRTSLRSLVLFALPLALGGCVHPPAMKLDHAEVTGFRVAFPPSFSIFMNVYVDVTNSNSYDVAARAVRGQIVIGNGHVLPIDWRAPGNGVWVRANTTQVVQVPVAIPIDLAIAVVREAYSYPSVPFHFTGRADVTATSTFQLEKDDYSLDAQGYVSRQQIEAAIPHF